MSRRSADRLLFGEWLLRTGRLDQAVLSEALKIQDQERSDNLRSSPRLLGQILLDDFSVFRSRLELNASLVEFEKVRQAVSARLDEMELHEEHSRPRREDSDAKITYTPIPLTEDRSLFGQFLIEKRKINRGILDQALEIQNAESKDSLRKSHRLLGEILLDDFHVFSGRVELNRFLVEYNHFKDELEKERTALMYMNAQSQNKD